MADPATIYFTKERFTTPSIEFYSHYWGDEVDIQLSKAIEHARPRWDDDSYGIRMMISHLLADSVMDETGYGLLPAANFSNAQGETRIVEFDTLRVWRSDGTYMSFEDYIHRFLEATVPNWS